MSLHDLVVAYSALGVHRTGTAVDDATRSWFATELERRGCAVDEAAYAFDRFDAEVTVTVHGREVDALPLWYSWQGDVDATITIAPGEPPPASVVRAELTGIFTQGPLAALRAGFAGSARSDGSRDRPPPEPADAAIVIATLGGDSGIDAIIAPNRPLAAEGGPPTVLVAPSSISRASEIGVRGRAAIVAGASATVVGRRGPESDDPLVVTTPLSGWFGCAAERGTGIAIALHLLDVLPASVPIVVVATTGHELEHEGLKRWLAGPTAAELRPRAIVHLGASVAAVESSQHGPELAASRFAFLRCPDSAPVSGEPDITELPATSPSTGVAAALESGRFLVVREPADWLGEGRQWSALGVPLLSLVGSFSRFHTAFDVPFMSTDPALLDFVARHVADATAALLAVVSGAG